jgi:hypothetical protein
MRPSMVGDAASLSFRANAGRATLGTPSIKRLAGSFPSRAHPFGYLRSRSSLRTSATPIMERAGAGLMGSRLPQRRASDRPLRVGPPHAWRGAHIDHLPPVGPAGVRWDAEPYMGRRRSRGCNRALPSTSAISTGRPPLGPDVAAEPVRAALVGQRLGSSAAFRCCAALAWTASAS